MRNQVIHSLGISHMMHFSKLQSFLNVFHINSDVLYLTQTFCLLRQKHLTHGNSAIVRKSFMFFNEKNRAKFVSLFQQVDDRLSECRDNDKKEDF